MTILGQLVFGLTTIAVMVLAQLFWREFKKPRLPPRWAFTLGCTFSTVSLLLLWQAALAWGVL